MDDSFELQSSMSPKVKGHQKHFRNGTTLLALKKNIRRSSVYDRTKHTVNNAELIIVGDSSSTGSSISSDPKVKVRHKSTIVISDTDYSDNEDGSNLSAYKKDVAIRTNKETSKKTSVQNNCLLAKDKLRDIELWIDKVNVENNIKTDITTYSELSTIYGDEANTNFKAEGGGYAITSTFVGPDCIGFDKLFKNVKENLKTDSVPLEIRADSNNIFNKVNQTLSDIVIDDSFIELDESLNTRLQKNRINDNVNSTNNRFIFDDPIEPKGVNRNLDAELQEINCSSKAGCSVNQAENNSDNLETNEDRHDLVSLLDDLYGTKWRKKEEHVLPKSEPRKCFPRPNNIHVANTERKPKLSVLYKNPYMETEKLKSNNLLQNLQKAKLQINAESPWSQRLNNLCDSDTHSESSTKMPLFRQKLDFDDANSDSDVYDKFVTERKTSNYFKQKLDSSCEVQLENDLNKENCSHLGKSLEERIKKKINKIKDTPKGNNYDNKTPKKQPANKKKSLKEKSNNECGSTKQRGVNRKTKSKSSSSSTSSKVKTDKKSVEVDTISVSSDEEWEKEISKIAHESKPVNGKYSFLASLSANIPIFKCDMSARLYRNNFKNYKDQLLEKLFNLYNEKIFDNAIPKDTEFEWNDRMRGTAGYCSCKKITRKSGVVERKVRIVLSTKVIDAAYRLRDTLIHELCHAATWIVNCVSDGHGSYWKAWAYKAMKTFPELPPIKRCHDYVINTKYTYKCTGCGYSIGRHSKSLDIERKRCGYCLGKFEVLLNKVTKKGDTKSVPATPKREATGFALFVKQNYSTYKNSQLKHGDVMKILGQKFQEMKVKGN